MIATIKKLNGQYLDHGKFESQEAAMEWFQPRIDKGVYGKPYSPEHVVAAGFNSHGDLLWEEYVAPEVQAEYSITFEEDQGPTQEEMNEESLSYLSATDWYVIRYLETGVDIPSDIGEEREYHRNRVVR